MSLNHYKYDTETKKLSLVKQPIFLKLIFKHKFNKICVIFKATKIMFIKIQLYNIIIIFYNLIF